MAIRPMEPSGQCESELAAAGVALPELLAPAGGLDQMLAAIAAGADAVYAGLDGFNARVSAHGFSDDEFARGCAVAHAHGVRVYVTLNVFVFDDELADAVALGAHAHALGADALIVADAGLACALRAAIPGVEIHLSTQAGAHSEGAVQLAAKELGVERVTTARELSVAEIGALCATGVPIEVFCHGAICIGYSGACEFSALRRGRSAMRGDCTQSCRLSYDLADEAGQSVVAVEGDRLLCPRDYLGIAHLPELVAAGVASLKIEGRMKNPDYVFNVVRVWRRALDMLRAGTWDADAVPTLERELGRSFNRGFTDAYLRGRSGAELMSFERAINQGVRVGHLVAVGHEEVTVELDAAVAAGDTLEIRFYPGADARPDVPKRWPQVPCPVGAAAGERVVVHCKRKVDAGCEVYLIRSAGVLGQTAAVLERMRVEADAVVRNARRFQFCRAFCQVIAHFNDDIVIDGIVLHGARLALHVHDDEARIARTRGLNHRWVAKTRHIVDDGGARLHTGARDLGVARVDAHADARLGELADNLDRAREFFCDRHLGGAGTRGLAAHVDDLRTLLNHALRVRNRSVVRVVLSPVGERIGRDIQDAHHDGHLDVEAIRGTLPIHVCAP